jgi:hypothetical protein
MVRYLRALGSFVLLAGLVTAGAAGWGVAGDAHFREVAEAYARHPEHALFQAEYWAAAVRHYGLLAAAVMGVLGGLVLGGMLLALAEVLRRLPEPGVRRRSVREEEDAPG